MKSMEMKGDGGISRGGLAKYHVASKELPCMLNVSLCGLGFNGNKLVAHLFGLPFKFCLQLFLPLGVSGIPNGLVIFDLVFDYGVKDLGQVRQRQKRKKLTDGRSLADRAGITGSRLWFRELSPAKS
jgi:hypothetical protein